MPGPYHWSSATSNCAKPSLFTLLCLLSSSSSSSPSPPPSSLLPPPSSLLLPPPFVFSLKAPKTILTCSQGREPPSHRAGAVTSQPRGRQEMEMIEGGWLGSIVKQKPQLHPKRVVPTQLVNSCLVGTKFILANPSDILREVRNNYLNMRSSDF